MDTLRQFGTGILLAVISVLLIIGGFSLAAVEGKPFANTAPTATFVLVIQPGLPTLSEQQPTDIATAIPQQTSTETQIPALPVMSVTPSLIGTPTALLPFIVSPTVLVYYPTVASCTLPFGYTAIMVKQYDTISSLALYYNMTPATLMQVNCLTSEQLQVGSVLYVVPKPVATYYPAPTQCGAPYGWTNYFVVSGDTLYNISFRYRVTVAQLKSANCLGSSDYIQVGQSLKVPYVATTAPHATATGYPTATAHPSSTPIPPTAVPPTAIPPTAVPPTEAPTGTPYASTGF